MKNHKKDSSAAYLAVSEEWAANIDAILHRLEAEGEPAVANYRALYGYRDGSALFSLNCDLENGRPGLGNVIENILKEARIPPENYMLALYRGRAIIPEYRGRLESMASPHPVYVIGTENNPFERLAIALGAHFNEEKILKWIAEFQREKSREKRQNLAD